MNPRPRRVKARPTPADWGVGMTVCIASLCERGSKIITVSDQMLSMDSYSADNLTCKSEPIHANWFALWSGADVSYTPLILDVARTTLMGMNTPPDQHDAANAIAEAHNQILNREIHNRILVRHGYNLKSFNDRGKHELTARVYNSLQREIKALDLGADFLVCGFDGTGEGHIFTFESQSGALRSCDALGFWAMGAGENNALSTMFFHAKKNGFNQLCPLDVAAYVVCEAKFMAESALGVGPRTFVAIMEANKHCSYLDPDIPNGLKDSWMKWFAPKIPDNGKEILMKTFVTYPNILDAGETRGNDL